MVSKIKKWLIENDYKHLIAAGQDRDHCIVYIEACLDGTEPLKVAKLYKQVEEWLAKGCNCARFSIHDGKLCCAFSAPFDSVYTLVRTFDGTSPTKIIKNENEDMVRGIMFKRFITTLDNTHDIKHNDIQLNTATIAFEDGAGKIHYINWYIRREIIRET